jgi:hypothetical protein
VLGDHPARQEAGNLVAVVTLSSATATLSSRWCGELTHCRKILVAYDRDDAGERGTNHLLSLSSRFQSIQVPFGKDISEFYLRGGNIYPWIEQALSGIER